MCVQQRFTSSANSSEPHSGTITGFNSSYFPSIRFLHFFFSDRLSLLSSHVMGCSGYQRRECTHTCATQHTKRSVHWRKLQRIKQRKRRGAFQSVCVCVCIQETHSGAVLIFCTEGITQKKQQKLAVRKRARKRRSAPSVSSLPLEHEATALLLS